jgi:hypothetical protein
MKIAAQFRPANPTARSPAFSSVMHSFPQVTLPISIDAPQFRDYLRVQIEPKSLKTLRLSFEGAAA